MDKIEPVPNNLTELLNDIGVRPSSANQERKNNILQNLNQRSARENWHDKGGPPKSRPQWNQQARLDSAVLNRQSVMNDSCAPNLSIQGQAMNFANPSTPNRPQWGAAPRDTLINALECANAHESTIASTVSKDTFEINLQPLSNRLSSSQKNETYLISSPKSTISSNATDITTKKSTENGVTTEELDRTVTSQPKEDNKEKTTRLPPPHKDELVECLATGRFDAKNKFLLRTVSNPELHKIDEVPEESTLKSTKLNRSLTDIIQSFGEPLFTSTKKEAANNSDSDSNTDEETSDCDDEDEMHTLSLLYQSVLNDDDDNDDEHKIKHSASEPVLKTNKKSKSKTTEIAAEDNDNDDDEMWCNEEDEENLEYRVKLDHEREEQLRKVLGDETLEIVREALVKNENDSQVIANLIPENKRCLVDTAALLTLITMNARSMKK
ncbi:hypothetical protein I4U23_000875 [Adineta vaga]|nr:hypothetical protein I4U23_000875 [Adineta vaga]